MHKNTKLLPYQRRDIFKRWSMGTNSTPLAKEYRVTRKTIYGTIQKGKLHIFSNRTSENRRYRTILTGLRRLTKTELRLAFQLAKRERRLRRYEKSIPGEMIHLDTKRLPLKFFL